MPRLLQIIPSLRGASESVNKQLSAMPDLGKDAGKLLGKNLGKNLEDGVGDGAKKGATEVKTRLSAQLGADVGTVLGRGIGGALHGSITVAAKAGELAIKGAMLGAAGVAGVALGGVGLALTKGFDRLKSIDQAKFKLQALGNDAAAVAKIMDSALASVKGTAFGMDDAVTAAASAVAAGIKPGQDLTKYLKEVGDAASIAGTSFEDMGSIFNKIQTSNKAYTDDLQQLSDRGLPIFTWLQKEYGVTGEALSKMVQNGEVDAAHFQKAIADNIGGAALKMGQSFEGSVQNAEAALGRLGAAFLAPIFGNAAGGIGSITDGLDKMTAWVNAHQPEIINFFTNVGVAAVSLAQDVVKSFGNILKGVGDFTHALGTVVGLFDSEKGAKLQAAGDSINHIGDVLIDTAAKFDVAKDKIRNWGAAAAEAASNAQNAVGGAVKGIGTQVGALPFKKVIEISADTADAEGKLHTVGNAIKDLPFKKTIEVEIHGTATGVATPAFDGVTVRPWLSNPDHPLIGHQNDGPVLTPNQNGIPILHKASGGPVFGAGSATSDSIPALLSNGEHVWTAAEVAKAGGQSAMYRMRAAVRGFAGGGMIPLGNIVAPPGDPHQQTAGHGGIPHRIIWWGGKDGIPAIAGPGDPLLPIDWGKRGFPDRNGTNPDGRWGGWINWLQPGDPGYIEHQHRRGIGKLGFSTGGAVGPDVQAAMSLVGTPYSKGSRFDCSGSVARVINAALGIPGGGLMTTKTAGEWLASRGFKPGVGGPGAISVGWYDHGPNPNDGHMAMTLSDGENAESGGKNSVFTVGAGASGASSAQFDHHMFLAIANAVAPLADAAGDSAAPVGEGPPTSGSGGGGGSLPSSISGLAGFGLSGLGSGVGTTGSGSDLSLFGNAAAAAVSGQVSSALGVFGVNDTPGFVKAASQLIGGIKVSEKGTGKTLFDGSNPLGSLFGQGSAGSSAVPLSASSTATGTPPPDDVHGTRAGQAPGPVFNTTIQARDAEGALDQWRRWQNERVAAKTSTF